MSEATFADDVRMAARGDAMRRGAPELVEAAPHGWRYDLLLQQMRSWRALSAALVNGVDEMRREVEDLKRGYDQSRRRLEDAEDELRMIRTRRS